MAKQFFRFLRGELNGYYIKNIHGVLNTYTEDMKNFLVDFKKQQFETDKIRAEDLYGLGNFAGVFLPRLSRSESQTSLRMTESHVEDDFEFSERGLFNTNLEIFSFFHCKNDTRNYFLFVRTTSDIQTTDINSEATSLNRSSLVGDEVPLGYISSEETDLFDEEGNVKPEKVLSVPPEGVAYVEFYGNEFLMLSEGDNSPADNLIRIRLTDSNKVGDVEYSERGLFVIPLPMFDDINLLATPELRSSLVGDEKLIGYISSEATNVIDDNGIVIKDKILSSPPANVAYSDFYGDQFLFLSEAESSYANLDPALYIELFKALQWVRYNGTSIKSFCRIVELTCPNGLVTISDIQTASDGKHLNVFYRYDETVDLTLKQQRLNLLEYIISIKFVQIKLVELTSRSINN